eukprot:13583863-Alexandrium_andersonii.AAC.1
MCGGGPGLRGPRGPPAAVVSPRCPRPSTSTGRWPWSSSVSLRGWRPCTPLCGRGGSWSGGAGPWSGPLSPAG